MKQIAPILFISTVLGLCLVPQANSETLDTLQGAWTMDGTDCGETFHKVNGKIEYKDRTASVTTGIIVTGDRILGPNATCTTGRIHKAKDSISALLNCKDSMMFDTIPVSFRIIDSDSFERFDPTFPESNVTYHRCKM